MIQEFEKNDISFSSSFVTIMCLSVGGCWAVIQIYSLAWIRLIAVSATLLIQYICLRYGFALKSRHYFTHWHTNNTI